jgi:hypothetical protein
MTIRTEHSEILEAIVVSSAVSVIQLQGDRSIVPSREAALFASLILQAFRDQPLSEIGRRSSVSTFDQDLVKWLWGNPGRCVPVLHPCVRDLRIGARTGSFALAHLPQVLRCDTELAHPATNGLVVATSGDKVELDEDLPHVRRAPNSVGQFEHLSTRLGTTKER